MSGDVQPRKRREKKKKKEDGPEEVVFQHQHAPPSPIVTEDINIHVQKEASTGGGLCAKMVFFVLLTVLAGLVGLIITEHRGLTDLDTVDTESRFAYLFEGWIDKPLSHDEEHLYEEEGEGHNESAEDVDEHDENDEDTEEHEDEEESAGHDDDEEEEEEDEDEEQATEETEEESEVTETAESEEEEQEASQADEEDEEEEEEEEADADEEEEEEKTEEDAEEKSEEAEEEEATEEDEEEEQDEGGSEAQEEEVAPEEEEESAEDEQEASEAAAEEEEQEESIEEAEDGKSEEAEEEQSEEAEEGKSKEAADKTESEEAADQAESEETATKETEPKREKTTKEKPVKEEAPKEAAAKPKKKAEKKESKEVPEEGGDYNKKINEKRSKEGTEESETPDLSRRNTIVNPPSLQEIEKDILNVEEEYSEDEEDYDTEEEPIPKPVKAKLRYEELQSKYTHTLSPSWQQKEVKEEVNKNYEDYEEEEGDDGEDEDEDETSEIEDEELLKRLEAKYGKLRQESEEQEDDIEEDENDEEDDEVDDEDEREEDFGSWKRVTVPSANVPEDSDSETEKNWSKQHSGAQAVYEFANITNSNDYEIVNELDQAQQNLENDAVYALTLFNKILERKSSSPRALYGKAQTLDKLADQKKSNTLLEKAITHYQQVLATEDVPDALFEAAAERCINRMRFRGVYGQAVSIHKMLTKRFHNVPKFANHLAVTYLTMNRINEARNILQETLTKWPNDGFALVHYGFILKTADNNLEKAVYYLQRGIKTREAGVIDGRFYFHLGDAFTRLGKEDEAKKVYQDGVVNKVFLSVYQRSLYNVERLTGKPWWKKEETPYQDFFDQLEKNWKSIRDEGTKILNQKGYFQPESENLRDVGDWKQFELYARGMKNSKNCNHCPFTCKMIETLPDAVGCRRGQIKFSVMHPGTHVWPHCGPTNCRLRAHLGLKVPPNTFLRVGAERRSWQEGKVIIFDDSFEHEVWHNGTDTRLVLIIDIWHPELTKGEKQNLSSI